MERAEELDHAFSEITRVGSDALLVSGGPMLFTNRSRALGFAARPEATHHLYDWRVRARRWTDRVRPYLWRAPPRRLRREDPEGREACRPARRAVHAFRIGDQPENSAGPWSHGATHPPRPRRRGDRMSNSAGGKVGIVSPTIRVLSGKRVRAPLPVRSPEPPQKERLGGGGSGRRSVALWRSLPARASLPVRAKSACAGRGDQ